MQAREIYEGSDGRETTKYYVALSKRGLLGLVAMNLLRAQKCSARAKKYRGGIRGVGSYRDLAYNRKAWSIEQLSTLLTQHRETLSIRFGWKLDPLCAHIPWVLYVDLPNGQVSFHSTSRMSGPDYEGDWDGQHVSADRIIAFCDDIMGSVQVEHVGNLLPGWTGSASA